MSKPMVVHGVTIPPAALAMARERMQQGIGFRATQIERLLVAYGVPEDGRAGRTEPVAMRAADRLIQNERRAGRIRFQDRLWVPVGCGSAA